MPRLIWSDSALKDVQRLYRFLAHNNIPAAKKAVKTIRQTVKIISRQPEAGRPVEGMNPEFREWLIDFGSSGYVALYRYDGDIALILAVKHQKEVGY
ncbi:type II toxin-antitoxin system RelE/ParE family toxin [Oceanospirillum beijerinckii]|uniref:type II toxin-antitoxin system RelE/ParE family toxin n=1 Tax=Oceanospirillum beijerinckii TaxID=64976 RepID=UPI0003F4ED0A|nr:type II toxin-antitoxin system RelE/ParE family toxin [Oceanospirillum beijerinckii]